MYNEPAFTRAAWWPSTLALALSIVVFPCTAGAAPPPQAVINNMDRDGDGRISAGEWRKAPHVFERLDANGDGYVTVEEIKAHRQGMAGRPSSGPAGDGPGSSPRPAPAAASLPVPHDGWIDVHFHIVADRGDLAGFESAAQEAIGIMNGAGIAGIVTMPPPRPRENFDVESIAAAAQAHAARIAFLGGGGTLNPMIQAVGNSSEVPAELRERFIAVAARILASGAKGFGEITAHHVSLNPSHGYEQVNADQPLLLLLADIAARHHVPIDMHFDPVPRDAKTPAHLNSPKNPPVLKENLAAFERLLAHNREATIVWAHAGSDPVGWYTPGLVREMLERHPNLYFSIRPVNHPDTDPVWHPRTGLNRAWVKLFEKYPDRFVLGTDSFVVYDNYSGQPMAPVIFEQKTAIQREGVNALLSALKDGSRRLIARDNAVRLYRLAE